MRILLKIQRVTWRACSRSSARVQPETSLLPLQSDRGVMCKGFIEKATIRGGGMRAYALPLHSFLCQSDIQACNLVSGCTAIACMKSCACGAQPMQGTYIPADAAIQCCINRCFNNGLMLLNAECPSCTMHSNPVLGMFHRACPAVAVPEKCLCGRQVEHIIWHERLSLAAEVLLKSAGYGRDEGVKAVEVQHSCILTHGAIVFPWL